MLPALVLLQYLSFTWSREMTILLITHSFCHLCSVSDQSLLSPYLPLFSPSYSPSHIFFFKGHTVYSYGFSTIDLLTFYSTSIFVTSSFLLRQLLFLHPPRYFFLFSLTQRIQTRTKIKLLDLILVGFLRCGRYVYASSTMFNIVTGWVPWRKMLR